MPSRENMCVSSSSALVVDAALAPGNCSAASRGDLVPSGETYDLNAVDRSTNEMMKCFILDVDGVLTSGQFFYTAEGKTM